MASHLSFCVRERSVCIHRDSVQVAVQLVTGFVILKKERKEKKGLVRAGKYDSLSFFYLFETPSMEKQRPSGP